MLFDLIEMRKHSYFPDERDAVKELFTRRKVIAEGERMLASLRRRRTIPDVETFGDIPRDTPNVGLNEMGDGRLQRSQHNPPAPHA